MKPSFKAFVYCKMTIGVKMNSSSFLTMYFSNYLTRNIHSSVENEWLYKIIFNHKYVVIRPCCIEIWLYLTIRPTIGLVLELNSTTTTKLDGDGWVYARHNYYHSVYKNQSEPTRSSGCWKEIMHHITNRPLSLNLSVLFPFPSSQHIISILVHIWLCL